MNTLRANSAKNDPACIPRHCFNPFAKFGEGRVPNRFVLFGAQLEPQSSSNTTCFDFVPTGTWVPVHAILNVGGAVLEKED